LKIQRTLFADTNIVAANPRPDIHEESTLRKSMVLMIKLFSTRDRSKQMDDAVQRDWGFSFLVELFK
jgi:hypothetical protein